MWLNFLDYLWGIFLLVMMAVMGFYLVAFKSKHLEVFKCFCLVCETSVIVGLHILLENEFSFCFLSDCSLKHLTKSSFVLRQMLCESLHGVACLPSWGQLFGGCFWLVSKCVCWFCLALSKISGFIVCGEITNRRIFLEICIKIPFVKKLVT